MVGVVVPVKHFSKAKQRLNVCLTARDRRRLAEAMCADVLKALNGARGVDMVAVITRDEKAIALAKTMGMTLIHDPENQGQGQTEAVAHAISTVKKNGIRTMVTIPGDIPLIMAEDIERIIQASRSADVVLVPAHDKRGTNAVALTPPDVMALKFGTDSFHPHLTSAHSLGLRTTVLELERVALDVDTPADLATLAGWPAETNTHSVLMELTWQQASR